MNLTNTNYVPNILRLNGCSIYYSCGEFTSLHGLHQRHNQFTGIFRNSTLNLKKEMRKQRVLSTNNLTSISNQVGKSYDNFILESINDHCLRMAVMESEYRWHYHSNTDELFIVLEGELKIEIQDNDTIFLQPGDFFKIPSGTIHKTSALKRTVNLCFERNADDTIFVDKVEGSSWSNR